MQQRHGFVDVLRGFSLLGILWVNIEFIVQASDLGFVAYDSALDQVVRWLSIALAQTKIYPIFALLFGYGLSIQIERARNDERALKPRYRRRMVGLVLLGILHGVLFFPGDILVIYALVGTLAYRFGSLATARLLRIAAWSYGLAAVGWLIVGFLELSSSPSAPSVDADVLAALTSGSFVDVAIVHGVYWLFTLLVLLVVQGPAVFACFLVGIALGRTTILADPSSHSALAHRALRWSPIGFAGAAVGASMVLAGGRWGTLGFAIGFAAAPFVAAAYVAILALTIGRRNGVVSRVLQASGRMSLTVYLLESIVTATLSYGYGFGLIGRVGPIGATALTVAIWLALSTFAVAWLRFFRFGPFEWLLRSFTYGKRQPILRDSGNFVSDPKFRSNKSAQ